MKEPKIVVVLVNQHKLLNFFYKSSFVRCYIYAFCENFIQINGHFLTIYIDRPVYLKIITSKEKQS